MFVHAVKNNGEVAPAGVVSSLGQHLPRNQSFLPIWLGALSLLFLIAFWARLVVLTRLWISDGIYSSSALVPFISGGLVYAQRHRLKEVVVRPQWAGLPLMTAAIGITVLLDALHLALSSATPVLMAAALCGAVLAIWGRAMLRRLAFPIAFLVAMVPVPPALFYVIDYPLQVLCAQVTAGLGRAAGIGVQRAGVFLVATSNPAVLLNVAPACNGVRSALAMLLISVLFSYLAEGAWRRKALVVLAAIPLAYFANFVRLFANLCLVTAAGPAFQAHEETSDYLIGGLMFAAALTLLFAFAGKVGCSRFREIA